MHEIGVTSSFLHASSSHSSSSPSASTAPHSKVLSRAREPPTFKRKQAPSLPQFTELSRFRDTNGECPHALDTECWSFYRTHYLELPKITAIARAYLAIPASSAGSERVFGAARVILSPQRQSLGSSKVSKLVFLKKNFGL